MTSDAAGAAPRLSFDVVIATRNRPEALALSIPLILGQSRLPEKLIVIDSSDDHDTVAATVRDAVGDWPGEVIVERSASGSAYQRNRGLEHVTADIVMFPDDDSLLYPGTTEAMMGVYERDTEGRIGALCARPAPCPPEGALPEGSYDMTRRQKRVERTLVLRSRIEGRVQALNPYLYIGNTLNGRHVVPDWFDEAQCVPVPWMSGFRMSFRMSYLREARFDEVLKGYALHEDTDLSFAVMGRGGLSAVTHAAEIYHHKFPSSRSNPRTMGVITVLNRCYITLKHAGSGGLDAAEARRARRMLRGFLASKLLLSLTGAASARGRAELSGVMAAMGRTGELFRADPAELPETYARLRSELLGD